MKRNKQFKIRLTEDEHQAFLDEANSRGMSAADFMRTVISRNCGNRKYTRVGKIKNVINDDYFAIRGLLAGQASRTEILVKLLARNQMDTKQVISLLKEIRDFHQEQKTHYEMLNTKLEELDVI